MGSRKNFILQEDSQPTFASPDLQSIRKALLAWYAAHRRDLPWRRTSDPYSIWVSEIMLQQTRVAAVEERYQLFLRNFPTVASLARADEADVLALWSGLGYYRRARMLHKAARMIVDELAGKMPATAYALRALPGVGVYTSAAIASIAYGEAVAVVDGNVERVVQRLAGWGSDSASPAELTQRTAQYAQNLLDPGYPGDFNQAMMELGATVCLPRAPRCLACPVRDWCKTRGEHPVTPRAPMRSEDAAYALVIRTGSKYREVLLDQRAVNETVMPGMWELPALREKHVPALELRMAVRHAIMQVNYYVRIRTVFEGDAEELTLPSASRRWVRLYDLPALPLTGLARKVLLRAKLSELEVQPEPLEEKMSTEAPSTHSPSIRAKSSRQSRRSQ
jgi:A/G-specific adenine glycosylase